MADNQIIIRGLCKAFGSKVVLENLDLDIPRGKSIAVIGASGTGKSVLLKCLLGLIEPDAGSITVDGVETVGSSRANREAMLRKFGMLFQGGALFDSLTIWENVIFRYRQGKGLTRQDAREHARKILAEVNLEERVLDLYPAEISGGMQKRVGLARAIADRPDILLFDEPPAGLDPITSGVINKLIRRAVDRLGATAITISHDMTSIRAIADEIAMIHEGRIVWNGPTTKMDNSGNDVLDQFVHGHPDGPLTRHAEQA
ncbi:MAG: ABC transporter ATP-binding protein [Candidatus Puniceispirillales bacterium]